MGTGILACAAGKLTVEDVMETLGDAFCALDRELMLLAANRKALTLLNVTQQALGLPLTTILPVPVRTELERALIQVAANGQSRRVETRWPLDEIPLQIDVHAAGACVHVYFRDMARFQDMKNELRRRHEVLALAEECAGIGVWDVDLKTLMLEGTEQFFRIMGLEPSSSPIAIDATRRLRFPDEQERVMQGFQQALESGADVFESEYRIRRPDGQTRWIFGRGRVIRDEQGVPYRYSGVDIDITDRKQSEAALRDSEERFRHVFAQGPLGIATAGTDFRFHAVNPAFCHMLGYTEAELTGMSFLDLVHPDDRKTCLAAGQALVEGGIPRLQIEERFVRKSGEAFWVAVNVAPIRALDGSVIYTVGMVEDIDERRRVRQALHDNEQRLRELNELLAQQAEERARQLASSRAQLQAFFDNSPDWLTLQRVTSDGTATYVDLNATAEAAYGLSRDKVIGRRLEDILGEEAAQVPLHHLRQCVATGAPQRYIARRTMAGRTRTIDVMFVLVPGEAPDGDRFIITTARDITELEELEVQLRQMQKMEAIGQLTGGIAHDFNNLLTPIYGALEMLQGRHRPEERLGRLISGALQSAERARVLVGRLLTFARRQHLEARPVSVASLVRGMGELIDRSLGPLIHVGFELPEDLPAAMVDPNQLELALLNLCVNARDAMPGGGQLRIEVSKREVKTGHVPGLQPGSYIRLAVADTGTGMDAETLRRAVEPFYTTKGAGRGTGLGLSMVHGLAAQSGGVLHLDSAPGRGTTAAIYLPLAQAAAERITEPEIEVAALTRKLTVLLVDDEELVRVGLTDILEGLGHTVIPAASGAAALAQLHAEPDIEIIITDYMMPGMTGGALVREARRIRPGLPALLLTGYSNLNVSDANNILRLSKPFGSGDLARMIRAALDEKGIVQLVPKSQQ